mgnify:CR=1 FL=1
MDLINSSSYTFFISTFIFNFMLAILLFLKNNDIFFLLHKNQTPVLNTQNGGQVI